MAFTFPTMAELRQRIIGQRVSRRYHLTDSKFYDTVRPEVRAAWNTPKERPITRQQERFADRHGITLARRRPIDGVDGADAAPELKEAA